MRAQSRRTLRSHEPLAPSLRQPSQRPVRGENRRSTPRVRTTDNGTELRLVPSTLTQSDGIERGTAIRLTAGFLAIAGFVSLGLWVEFGALGKATYLLAALSCFSLYGAVTLRPDPRVRQRGAATGRRP
jgi:hypothetical protein